MERDKVHGDEGGHGMKIIKLQLRKEKEKNKTRRSRKKYMICFVFVIKTLWRV
jgi:hypothetical protein